MDVNCVELPIPRSLEALGRALGCRPAPLLSHLSLRPLGSAVDGVTETLDPTGHRETGAQKRLTPTFTPTTQVALLDEDLEPEPEEEAEFPHSQKIIIVFTAYEKGHKAKDEEILGAIVAHLNKLEGVDLEPDFLSKSAAGPWEILVTADCANQFREQYKDVADFRKAGIPCPIAVKYQTLDEKFNGLPRASNKALASAYKDASAHLVVRNYKFELKSLITISSLAKAVENQGFFFLQGNQERTKILTKEGILVTQGKKEVRRSHALTTHRSWSGSRLPVPVLVSADS